MGSKGGIGIWPWTEFLCSLIAVLLMTQGETLEAIVQSTTAVAEGVLTSRSANALAQKLDVDCPIINGIFRVLHGQALVPRHTPQQ